MQDRRGAPSPKPRLIQADQPPIPAESLRLLNRRPTPEGYFSVAFGAIILSNFMNISGMPNQIVDWVNSLEIAPITVVLVICLIYIALGCVFEGIGMILLTVPIFFPVVQSLGFDLIWFGIVVIMVTEISLITPPIGMNVFVLKTIMPEMSLWGIFAGISPFFVADIVRLALIVFIPGLTLYLPGLMGG